MPTILRLAEQSESHSRKALGDAKTTTCIVLEVAGHELEVLRLGSLANLPVV